MARQLMTVQLVRALLDRGNPGRALSVAGTVDPQAAPPEETYYCAEVLFSQGEHGSARDLLEGLILHHPESIYASKARVLLAKTHS
jgi:hypothetical protein